MSSGKQERTQEGGDLKDSMPVEGEGPTTILDNEEVLKQKERRKKRQRDEITEKLKRQGINLEDNEEEEEDVEGFYDTKAEVKKEDGVTIEPFRMDGFFAKDGRYVERGNEDDDPWYQQWKDQKKDERYQEPKKDIMETEEKTRTPLELRQTLLKYVQPNENVIKAIKRLGKKKGNAAAKKRPWMKNKKRKTLKIMSADEEEVRPRSSNKGPMDTGEQKKAQQGNEGAEPEMTKSEKQKADNEASGGVQKVAASEEEAKRREAVEELTSAANELMSMGDHNIYQETHKELSEFVAKATRATAPTNAKEWEYRFNGDTKVHSGFTSSQMQRWNKAGYFKKAQVRKIGSSNWMTCEASFQFE